MLVEGRPEGILLGRSSDGGLDQTSHHFQNAPPKWERVIQACKPWIDQLWSSLSILIPETDPRQTSLCTFCRAIWLLVAFVILSLSGFSHTRKIFFEDKILFVKPITYWCCLFSWNLRAISLQSLFLYVYHPFIAFLHFLQIFISTKFNFLTKTRFYVLLLTDSSANTPASSAENLRLVFPSLEKLASHVHVCPCVCVQQLLFNTKHSYSCVISWQRFTWLPSQKRQVIWELGSLSISQSLLLVPFPHLLRIVLSSCERSTTTTSPTCEELFFK